MRVKATAIRTTQTKLVTVSINAARIHIRPGWFLRAATSRSWSPARAGRWLRPQRFSRRKAT